MAPEEAGERVNILVKHPGHICQPPMLWFWRRKKWPEGSIWECPVCERWWCRNDQTVIGWEWCSTEERE